MPTTHIKHCKQPRFNKIYHFESFYYGFRGKIWFRGKNCKFKLWNPIFVKTSSFNAIYSPIIVASHCGSGKQILFYIYWCSGGKKSFPGVKIKILSYKTNFFRQKFSFHAIFLSNIVVYYYPSNKSWFFFTFTDFQGVKNFSGG